jgi:hypothetical protein
MYLSEDYVLPSLDNTFGVRGDSLCACCIHLSRGENVALYTEIMFLSMEIMTSVFGDYVSVFLFGRWEPFVWFWRNLISTCRESWRLVRVQICVWEISLSNLERFTSYQDHKFL